MPRIQARRHARRRPESQRTRDAAAGAEGGLGRRISRRNRGKTRHRAAPGGASPGHRRRHPDARGQRQGSAEGLLHLGAGTQSVAKHPGADEPRDSRHHDQRVHQPHGRHCCRRCAVWKLGQHRRARFRSGGSGARGSPARTAGHALRRIEHGRADQVRDQGPDVRCRQQPIRSQHRQRESRIGTRLQRPRLRKHPVEQPAGDASQRILSS